jgi:hypothetical protein
MRVRQYQQSDLDTLRRIHAAQNFPYAFPDLTNPLFLTKIVLTDEDTSAPSCDSFSSLTENGERSTANLAGARKAPRNDNILGAALLRLTAEAYLLLDPQYGTPRQRWQALLALHSAAQHDAQQRGLEDVHAWLPPVIATKFGRRLQRLGWRRDDQWTPYCKRFYD